MRFAAIANDNNPQHPDQELFFFEDECDAVTCVQTIAREAPWTQLAIFRREQEHGWVLHLYSTDGVARPCLH